jgi:hypothetical protein
MEQTEIKEKMTDEFKLNEKRKEEFEFLIKNNPNLKPFLIDIQSRIQNQDEEFIQRLRNWTAGLSKDDIDGHKVVSLKELNKVLDKLTGDIK